MLFMQIINRNALLSGGKTGRTLLINQGTARLWDHLYTQRFSGGHYCACDGLKPKMLQMLVGLLDFCNLVDVLQADGTDDLMSGFSCSFLYAGCFLQKVRGWWRLRNESERAVRLDSDEGRCWCAGFDMSRSCVELFTEIHGLDTASTQRRTYWGCWCCFARWNQNALYRWHGYPSSYFWSIQRSHIPQSALALSPQLSTCCPSVLKRA